MLRIRAVFEKAGTAIYISHLDLNRCIMRALRKSGLPVWYTEGFNPHPFVTFALPLALGVEGRQETMDFRLEDDGFDLSRVAPALNAALPAGIRVLSAALAQMEPGDIAWAEYEIRLCPGASQDEAVREALGREEIVVEKTTKSGSVRCLDLRQHMRLVGVENGTLRVLLSAGSSENVSPELLVGYLRPGLGLGDEPVKVIRNAFYNKNFDVFR